VAALRELSRKGPDFGGPSPFRQIGKISLRYVENLHALFGSPYQYTSCCV